MNRGIEALPSRLFFVSFCEGLGDLHTNTSELEHLTDRGKGYVNITEFFPTFCAQPGEYLLHAATATWQSVNMLETHATCIRFTIRASKMGTFILTLKVACF